MKRILTVLITLLLFFSFSGCRKDDSETTNEDKQPLFVEDIHGALVPVFEGVDTSELDPTLFYKDNKGRMAYSDENIKILQGVDVSVFQGDIDWEKVKADGIDFAFMRCGGRGYGEKGIMYEDESFADNCKKAAAAGIDVGAYFFSQAVTEEEAVEEAVYVIDMLKGLQITFPVVFDWEPYNVEGSRTKNITGEQVTSFAKRFCDYVKNAGYDPMIYLNCEYGYFKYDLTSIKDYKIWLAEYSDKPSYYYNYRIWQYAKTGTVDGINGQVDMNIALPDNIVG